MADAIEITVAEQSRSIAAGTSLLQLRDQLKPGADVLVLNGFPVTEDCVLAQDDAVVFIRRGETPSAEEFEAALVARHSPGVHAVLREACVGIAGAGGLGSAVAVALTRMGIGTLVIVDFDVVEPSNLNRQQYFIDQIGLPKVEALRQNLSRMNPYVRLITHACRLGRGNLSGLFASAAILVEALDRAEEKAMAAESWVQAFPRRPIVMASGLAGHLPSNSIETRQLGQSVVVGDLDAAAMPGRGLMAPRVGIAAHHQANAVIRLLLGEAPR